MTNPTCDPSSHPSTCMCCRWRLETELPMLRAELEKERAEQCEDCGKPVSDEVYDFWKNKAEQAEQEAARLREALKKIASGDVESGVLTDAVLADRPTFTARMFTWCQETARAALRLAEEEGK